MKIERVNTYTTIDGINACEEGTPDSFTLVEKVRIAGEQAFLCIYEESIDDYILERKRIPVAELPRIRAQLKKELVNGRRIR